MSGPTEARLNAARSPIIDAFQTVANTLLVEGDDNTARGQLRRKLFESIATHYGWQVKKIKESAVPAPAEDGNSVRTTASEIEIRNFVAKYFPNPATTEDFFRMFNIVKFQAYREGREWERNYG